MHTVHRYTLDSACTTKLSTEVPCALSASVLLLRLLAAIVQALLGKCWIKRALVIATPALLAARHTWTGAVSRHQTAAAQMCTSPARRTTTSVCCVNHQMIRALSARHVVHDKLPHNVLCMEQPCMRVNIQYVPTEPARTSRTRLSTLGVQPAP